MIIPLLLFAIVFFLAWIASLLYRIHEDTTCLYHIRQELKEQTAAIGELIDWSMAVQGVRRPQ